MTATPTAAKRYPLFIICEDIRAEVGGKISLIGAYLGYSITLSGDMPKDAPAGAIPALPALSFALAIFGEAGTYPCKAQITAPGNKEYPERDLGTATLAVPQTHVLVLREQPFPVAAWGTYSVRFQVGSDSYSFEFDIVHASPPLAL